MGLMLSSDSFSSLSHFHKLDPGNVAIVADLVDEAVRLGEADVAQKFLSVGLKLDASYPKFLFEQARLHISRNEVADACRLLQGLLSSGVDNVGVRFNFAYALFLARDFQQARLVLLPLVETDPVSFLPSLLLMARLVYHDGDLGQVRALCERFLAFEADNAEALGLLALSFVDDEDFEQAEDFARRALLLDARNLEALVSLGNVGLSVQDLGQADQCFGQAVEFHPFSGRAWVGRGLVFMARQDLVEAEKALTVGLKYLSEHVGSWHVLAWCQIGLKNFVGAEYSFQQALALNRNFAESHGGLAVVAALQGKVEVAKEAIKRAKGLDVGGFAAPFAESLLLSGQGDVEKGQKVVDSLLAIEVAPGVSLQKAVIGLLRGGGVSLNIHVRDDASTPYDEKMVCDLVQSSEFRV